MYVKIKINRFGLEEEYFEVILNYSYCFSNLLIPIMGRFLSRFLINDLFAIRRFMLHHWIPFFSFSISFWCFEYRRTYSNTLPWLKRILFHSRPLLILLLFGLAIQNTDALSYFSIKELKAYQFRIWNYMF